MGKNRWCRLHYYTLLRVYPFSTYKCCPLYVFIEKNKIRMAPVYHRDRFLQQPLNTQLHRHGEACTHKMGCHHLQTITTDTR